MASSSAISSPVAQWLNLTVTETGRSAYVYAMLQSGYEVLPAITLDDLA